MPDLTANQHADAIIDALGGTTPADVAFSLAALLALAQRTEQAEAKAQHHLVGMEEAKVLWRGAEARAKQAEKERDGLKGALDTTMIAATRRAAERDEARIAAIGLAEKLGKCNVQRDRLTAALVGSVAVLKHYDFPGYPPEVLQAINRLSAAREALNPGDGDEWTRDDIRQALDNESRLGQ